MISLIKESTGISDLGLKIDSNILITNEDGKLDRPINSRSPASYQLETYPSHVDLPVTLEDLILELKSRAWLFPEKRIIASTGDLVLADDSVIESVDFGGRYTISRKDMPYTIYSGNEKIYDKSLRYYNKNISAYDLNIDLLSNYLAFPTKNEGRQFKIIHRNNGVDQFSTDTIVNRIIISGYLCRIKKLDVWLLIKIGNEEYPLETTLIDVTNETDVASCDLITDSGSGSNRKTKEILFSYPQTESKVSFLNWTKRIDRWIQSPRGNINAILKIDYFNRILKVFPESGNVLDCKMINCDIYYEPIRINQ